MYLWNIYRYIDYEWKKNFSDVAPEPPDARKSPVSASNPLRDLLAQLNRELAVKRLAVSQGVTLGRNGAGYRGCVCSTDSPGALRDSVIARLPSPPPQQD